MDFVRKVPVDGSDMTYILSCEWNNDNFSLIVIDTDHAWTGKLSSSDLVVKSSCDIMGKSVQDYFAELKMGLTSDTEGQFCFVLDCKSFLVKKKDLKSGIKVKYCSIPVQEYPIIQAYNNLLSTAIDKLDQFATDKKHLQDEVSALTSDRDDLVKNLELLAEMKNSLEKTLYAKFLEVLNAKKAHLVTDALAAERELGIKHSFSAPPQNTEEAGNQALASSKQKRKIESCFTKQQSNEAAEMNPLVEDCHYDSETEEDTEDEAVEGIIDNKKEQFELPRESVVSSTLLPSTSMANQSVKSSERILPKRGKKGLENVARKDIPCSVTSALNISEKSSHGEKFQSLDIARNSTCASRGKEMHKETQDISKPSEWNLPKRMKRGAEKSAIMDPSHCLGDSAVADTVPVPAVNEKSSDNEEETFEQLNHRTAVPSTSAAAASSKSPERILPKRRKGESKQTGEDPFQCVIPKSSVDDMVFDSQALLDEFP